MIFDSSLAFLLFEGSLNCKLYENNHDYPNSNHEMLHIRPYYKETAFLLSAFLWNFFLCWDLRSDDVPLS